MAGILCCITPNKTIFGGHWQIYIPAAQRELLAYESHVGMQHITSKSIWNSTVINRKSPCKRFPIVGPKPISEQHLHVCDLRNTENIFYLFSACVLGEAHLPRLSGMCLFSTLFASVKSSTVKRLGMYYQTRLCVSGCACVPTRRISLSGTTEKIIDICQSIILLFWIPTKWKLNPDFIL